MKLLVNKATPAAIAILRQATAISPKRKKASDGLLPSRAHLSKSPDSDHNTGLATDLTDDPANGIDCAIIFTKLHDDERVKYLIFKGRIWSKEKGNRPYTGSNPHNKHLHISIKAAFANDKSNWFAFMPKPKAINKIKAAVRVLPKKKA